MMTGLRDRGLSDTAEPWLAQFPRGSPRVPPCLGGRRSQGANGE